MRRLPPYGKALQSQRDRGEHPDPVYVFYAGERWPRAKRCAPQLVVPAADYAPGQFAWWLLAGLHVVLVAHCHPAREQFLLWRDWRRAQRGLGARDDALTRMNAIEADWANAALHWNAQSERYLDLAAEIGRYAARLTLVAPAGAVHPLLSSYDPRDPRAVLRYAVADGAAVLWDQQTRSGSGWVNRHGWSDADHFAYLERRDRHQQELEQAQRLPGELRSLTGAEIDVAA